jgi:streptomycin 6-kinase
VDRRDLLADPATTGTLVHGDLHYANVLAGDREAWLTIDPKPVSGDPHFEPAPMLWNRFVDPQPDPEVPDDAWVTRCVTVAKAVQD